MDLGLTLPLDKPGVVDQRYAKDINCEVPIDSSNKVVDRTQAGN